MKTIRLDLKPARWLACKILGQVTPSVYWSRLSCLRLREVDRPALPGDDWVRIRPLLGGICGTDIGAILQRSHPASILRCFTRFPIDLGHEGVGVIEEVGKGVAGWDTGQRVIVEPMLSCGPRRIDPACPRCRAGQFSLCENLSEGALPRGVMIGTNHFTGGTWGESLVAHQSQLFAVPDSVDDETATLIDPIACAVHAVLRHTPAAGQRVIVIGAGIVGLGVVAALHTLAPEAEVTLIARYPHQEELGRRFGAADVIRSKRGEKKADRYQEVADRVGGKRFDAMFGNQALSGGYDVVYDCIGTGESLTDAMKFVHGRGTVVECATPTITVVDTTPLWFAEVSVIGCYGRCVERLNGQEMHTYEVVLSLLQSRRLDLTGLLTHTFRLEQYREALGTIVQRSRSGLVKAAFDHRRL
ncbi:MAG: alcohol dehydrogenase catalytic domain-containing protein [Phycisphaerae bacterium]|nr:alcohol dehydrogenase catalytic domain-containing protein [Phycisphaerae bacterium]